MMIMMMSMELIAFNNNDNDNKDNDNDNDNKDDDRLRRLLQLARSVRLQTCHLHKKLCAQKFHSKTVFHILRGIWIHF